MKGHLVAALVHAPISTFEFGCVAEVFGGARRDLEVDWYDFAVVGVRPGPVLSTGGVAIHVPCGLETLAEADTIVVPCWDAPEPPGDDLVASLRAAYERGARILSICSGAFVLAAAGLLDGRRATTHWLHADELKRRHPAIRVDPDVLYVDEGQIVTGAGSAAGLDMLLHVIRQDHGAKVCNAVARHLVIPPYRDGGQAQFVQRPVPQIADTRLANAIQWMREHAREEQRTDQLASMAAMSPRSFFRRFREATGMAPYDWLIRERVAITCELLEEGRLSVEQIAVEAGFGAAETMRHHFRRVVGRSPLEYRRTFTGQASRPGMADAA